MGIESSRVTGRWYMRRLVPALTFITSFAVLIGGVSLLSGQLSGEPVEIDGKAAGLIFLLILIVCSLLWLLATQLIRLHQSRENLRLTIESSTDIVVLLDSKARYLEIFARSGDQLIATRDNLVGQSVREFMGEELGARVESAVSVVLHRGKKQTLSYSLPLNGQTLWFEAVLSKRDADTVVAMIRDVTREKKLTKELDQQRRFMENILNAISDPIFMKDEQHRWLYGNDAFCAVLGRKRSEYYGKTDFAFWPDEIAKTFIDSDQKTLTAMREVENEEVIFSPDGEQRTILTKKTPFVGVDGNKTLVGIIRDITDRKQMETQLQDERARQIAAARLASLGEMAGGVAHEINNPLAIISGYAGRLQDLIAEEPLAKDRAIEIVRRIDMTTTRIAAIVKGLRAISRDGGFDPLEYTSVDLIVSDTLGLCTEKFRSQGVSIETNLQKELYVRCRSVQISQVLLNLLTNAFFAVTKNSSSSILVEAREVGEFIELAVIDSGVGVPSEIRERIFEPFFTTKPVGVGTGLGLSIAASIIREHGGELSLDDASERTRFVIRLPVGFAS